MRYSQYKYKFYLNASHAIYINGIIGDKHPHTWEIQVNAVKKQCEFVKFEDVEHSIEFFLEEYQNKFLNDYEPFNIINPTLENITDILLKKIQEKLEPLEWVIFAIEVSETPARSYVISLVENRIISDLQKKNQVNDIIAKAFQVK